MTMITNHTFICNLCGEESGRQKTNVSPETWVSMMEEDHQLDKTVTDAHVCDECCLQIIKQHPSA